MHIRLAVTIVPDAETRMVWQDGYQVAHVLTHAGPSDILYPYKKCSFDSFELNGDRMDSIAA